MTDSSTGNVPDEKAESPALRVPSELTKISVHNRNSHAVEYQRYLIELRESRDDFFDRTIITLSAGGFGLTLACLRVFSGDNGIIGMEVLISSWILWGFACALLLWAHKKEAKLLDQSIGEIETHLSTLRTLTYDVNASDEEAEAFLRDNSLPSVKEHPHRLSTLGAICCLLGFVALVIFGGMNAENFVGN